MSSRSPRSSPFTRGVLAALACAVALAGCNSSNNDSSGAATSPTVGSLNVNVTPASAAVTVTGPASYTQSFTGNQLLVSLAPGQYTAKATAPGFVDQSASINVVAGQTASISMILQAKPIITESPRAVFRDANGNLIPIDSTNLQNGFVFYAWLEDHPLGVDPGHVTSTHESDPGKPLLIEQDEVAPSFTQNLAVAWVGYNDHGVIRPVIGADVRWEIDQFWAGRVNSMQFGTSDDNRVALGYGVFDDQADTRTNNGSLANERFPLVVSDYPLYNVTKLGSPLYDGMTWVTLFSPDKRASGRVVAVATINGEEIGKQILYKNFAPKPLIGITKTVNVDIVNLGVAGTGTVTWTVTVTNTGSGDATNVTLNDILFSGAGGTYSITPPAGCSAGPSDGFTCPAFDLPAAAVPPAPGTYLLGSAASFGVLANGTVTNTGSSVVKGDLGVSAGSAITGFPPGLVQGGTIHNNDAVAQAAQGASTAAYVNLAARPSTQSTVDPSNHTLLPGVYPYSSSVLITGPVTLDAGGDPNAEFVFKIGSTLTTAAGVSINLINGASPCNVYWAVGTSATIGAGSFVVGNILAQSSITANTGASISGRALAQTGSVTLAGNAVTVPVNCGAAPQAPGTTRTLTFTATVTAPGRYCNEGLVASFSDDSTPPVVTTPGPNAQACFTAIAPVLSIVKDFVADDNVTTLGHARTVGANVAAKLRVRVVNGGNGDAAGVAVHDALTSGNLANYTLIGVSSGTGGGFDPDTVITNGSAGWDTVSATTVMAGHTLTFLFQVKASQDGTYCDTASISAGGSGNDQACLTVATPNLTITKVDDPAIPATVLPGHNYTSTIKVTNTGTATANDVVIFDALGLNTVANVRAIYVSSSLDGASGTLANSVVTAKTINILAGETKTFTVVSSIPASAASGTYCDTATVTSSNAATKQATDCVKVPAYAAEQTQLVDQIDPINLGGTETYFAVMSVEKLSNEGVKANVITFSFGLSDPTGVGNAGLFPITSTKLYLDSSPIIDPATGVIVSGPTNPTAVLQTLGTDYTVANSTELQVLTMTPTVVLQPGTCLYAVQQVLVPTSVPPNHQYTAGFIWTANGVSSTIPYHASSSEPTTVLP